MQKVWRKRRMQMFYSKMGIKKGLRVIDLGGRPEIWGDNPFRLDITILNFPEEIDYYQGTSLECHLISGDACSAKRLSDNSFDIVFSNSVIEHIPAKQQMQFADTVKRLAPAFWVQTPSISFPIEAHCNLPFWWKYPNWLQQWWIHHWASQRNTFLADQMTTTSGLSKRAMQRLFGETEIYIERAFGLEKSYTFYKRR